MSTGELTNLFDTSDVRSLLAIEKAIEVRNTRVKFAREFHVNTSGQRMDFESFPYLRDIYESLSKTIVLQGSTQSMKSEFVVIDHLAMAYCGLSVFYVVPKYEFRNTYVQNRINRCVESVPEYKKIVGEGFFDSIGLKNFGKGVIRYVGSNVFADMREFPAGALVIDEVDECHQENLAYAHDRLSASIFKFKRYLGNPRIKGFGINKHFLDSDQREWFVPCKSCGKYCHVDWFKAVVREVIDSKGTVVGYRLRDTDWEPGCRRDVHMICELCGGILDKTSNKGMWIAGNPESAIQGYHLSKLCNDLNSVTSLWIEFQNAQNDPQLMQRFYNSSLGLPFVAAGNRVTVETLQRCAADYEVRIEQDRAYVDFEAITGECSMGIDVGATLDVRISEIRGNKRRLVFAGKLKPSIESICELIDRYDVRFCVIDHGPEIGFVNDLKEVAPCDLWSCVYRSVEGADGRKKYNTIDRIISADRTECLDRAFSLIQKKRNVVPSNFQLIFEGGYVSEMCGPVRILTEDAKGRKRFEWTSCEDHQRHADVYDMLAAEALVGTVIDSVDCGIEVL